MPLPQTTPTAPVLEIDTRDLLNLHLFSEVTGFSPTTIWRYRRRGWLTVVNISGRNYVTREEYARFRARLLAGEFARVSPTPTAKTEE